MYFKLHGKNYIEFKLRHAITEETNKVEAYDGRGILNAS